MRTLFLLLLLGLFAADGSGQQKQPAAKKPVIPFYFPVGTFQEAAYPAASDSLAIRWYSEQLAALKEPVLYTNPSSGAVYRFTWLRAFHYPVSVRIQQQGDSVLLYWKLAAGASGYAPGKLTVDRQKGVSRDDWNRFLQQLEAMDFWKLPTEINDAGLDGSQWILEGKEGGHYHVVERWMPNPASAYYQCCNFLLGLTDLKIKGREKY